MRSEIYPEIKAAATDVRRGWNHRVTSETKPRAPTIHWSSSTPSAGKKLFVVTGTYPPGPTCISWIRPKLTAKPSGMSAHTFTLVTVASGSQVCPGPPELVWPRWPGLSQQRNDPIHLLPDKLSILVPLVNSFGPYKRQERQKRNLKWRRMQTDWVTSTVLAGALLPREVQVAGLVLLRTGGGLYQVFGPLLALTFCSAGIFGMITKRLRI